MDSLRFIIRRLLVPRLKSFISSNKWILAILFIASVIRILFFFQITDSPCSELHHWKESDMNFFHKWAIDIAGGDLLTDRALHPFHSWHRFVAEQYFRLEECAISIRSDADRSPHADQKAMERLWDRWYGGKRFHQEPLYPYLISMIYRFSGPQAVWVRAVQLVLGIGNILFIYLISKAVFGYRVAIAASIIALLYSPLMFYEILLLRTTLISFFGLLLVVLMQKAFKTGSHVTWGVAGLVTGMAILLKSVFILFFIGTIGLLVVRFRRLPKQIFRYGAILTSGVFIALTPLIVRNISVGVSPLGLSSVTAVTFLSANSPDSIPRGFFISRYIANIMGKTDGAVLPTIIETMRTQSVIGFAKLLWQKCILFWHWFEVPNNANFYYCRIHSSILKFLPITFFGISALILLGIGIAVYERRPCGEIHILLIVHVMTILLTYVSSRFRMPFVAASIPFAAFAAERIFSAISQGFYKKAAVLCSCLIILSTWAMSPLPSNLSLIRASDYRAGYAVYFEPRLLDAMEKKNCANMKAVIEASRSYEPELICFSSAHRPLQNQNERDIVTFFSRIYSFYAHVLARADCPEKAEQEAIRAAYLQKRLQSR